MSDFSQSESLTHIFTGPNVISVNGSKYFTSLHLPHYISNVITFATILVGSHDRKQMWLPCCRCTSFFYLILNAARPCVAVLFAWCSHFVSHFGPNAPQNPADAPPESRGTTRIQRTPTESYLHLQRVSIFGASCARLNTKRQQSRGSIQIDL